VFRDVGSVNGIEAKLAREAGIEFVGVASGKLRRSSRGPLGLLSGANLRDAFQIPVGIGQAMRAVRAFRPDVVLATGGYVSVPPVIAAGLNGVPVLTHEQTVTVGLANKIAGRFARRIALTFEGAMRDLPQALRAKAFVTGNPVRAAIFSGNKTQAVSRFFPNALPNDDVLPCLYVTGGAQGSRIINRAVLAALPGLLPACRIIHQCGQQPEGMEQDFDALTVAVKTLPEELQRRYYLTRFVGTDEIGNVYALSDLLVARSGAGTVTEACALGKPALFIPLVPTGGDEQTRNAQRSADAGGAVILPQAQCDTPHLLEAIHPLLADPAHLRTMGDAAHTLARPNAASDLADALLELAPNR
jgi:UDP-N-acetylglucosamine--N-acetylmuramyl-(pentapeptide) pyrophosphoryl-undecaprenol N-acetylglucosamine transferase